MYSIGNVIYGVPITPELDRAMRIMIARDEDESPELLDLLPEDYEGLGFETCYHGSAPQIVGWIGVQVGNFNVCQDIRVSDFADVPLTDDEIKQTNDLISNLPEEIRNVLQPIDIYVVWSTS